MEILLPRPLVGLLSVSFIRSMLSAFGLDELLELVVLPSKLSQISESVI